MTDLTDTTSLDTAHLTAAQHALQLWLENSGPIKVPTENERKFRVCYPLIAHAMNHVETALTTRHKQPLVAASSARIAFEHALTAQWVLLTYGGEDTLVKAMQATYLTRTREFYEAADQPDELADLAQTQPAPGQERSYTMQLVCDRFSPTRLFYDTYRDLSGAIHPSYDTLRAYLDLDPLLNPNRTPSIPAVADSTSTRAPRPRISRTGHGAPTSLDTALGLSAVTALDALFRLRRDTTGLSQIAAIATAAQLPHDLDASDQSPHLQHPATPQQP